MKRLLMLTRRRHGNDVALYVSLATRRQPMASRQWMTVEVDWSGVTRQMMDGACSFFCHTVV